MSEHVYDDLPRLLTGDADRATVSEAAVHLRSCEDCRHELISAVVSHAALTSAVRFAPDLTVHDLVPLDQPDEDGLPDLSAIFAQIRQESAEEPEIMQPIEAPTEAPVSPIHRAGRARWLVAASVAALAVAGGGVALATHHTTSSTQDVALAAYDKGTTPAEVKLIAGDEMKLNASSLPALTSNEYYEVWLTDGARVNMLPVGPLNASRTGDFTVPASVMKNYAAVEVSIQQIMSTGVYSGVSVLRGTYA